MFFQQKRCFHQQVVKVERLVFGEGVLVFLVDFSERFGKEVIGLSLECVYVDEFVFQS